MPISRRYLVLISGSRFGFDGVSSPASAAELALESGGGDGDAAPEEGGELELALE